MSKISVIICTYKEPEALDLCLKSCIKGCYNLSDVEIILVVDGFYNENKHVINKYKDGISVLNLEQNVGMIKAMNLGTYNASSELVFHVQDDNVFPKNWDFRLLTDYKPGMVLTANQIEPYQSIFPQFNIKDLGRDPKTFDLRKGFWDYELTIRDSHKIEETGSTFPFLISKVDYLKVGGFDETYPSPWVVDCEFFMKCKLIGLKMIRTSNLHFYHFVSLGTQPTPEKQQEKKIKELESLEYFKYKWGDYMRRNNDNSVTF
jgi:glycosyltransferase involved in cell wall biosynthesis